MTIYLYAFANALDGSAEDVIGFDGFGGALSCRALLFTRYCRFQRSLLTFLCETDEFDGKSLLLREAV
jgi:hypothetical protein